VHGTGDGVRRPAVATYVKVFARRRGRPTPVFHKDGYTDVRGKFDYATISSDASGGGGFGGSGGRVERFAILVVSPALGAVIEEVQPPPSG